MQFIYICGNIYIMKEIMEILNKNGYLAYIVGGYVRDYLLGITSFDVDICTNAPISEIVKMFDGRGKAYPQYYAYHISEGDYEYDITTFRRELRYKKNKPVELKIAKNLKEDLLRRDFTINTFAMDKNGYFIDLLNSKKDLDSKIIKCVGDTEKKFEEDKTRIIRALRFACTLDFELSDEIINFISKKAYILNDVPKEFKRKELDRIFDSAGLDKFLYYIRRFEIQKYFNIDFVKVIHSYNKYGIWAQMNSDLPFSKNELRIINSIRSIISKGNITMDDIKNNSEEVLLNASFILNQVDRLKVLMEISKLHSFIDMDADIDLFFKYVNTNDVVKTYRLVERRIIEGYLNNDMLDIEEFLRNL